ncbi:hypothetical protein [Halorubellus litoreus]|uniref:Helix-turn-helix domain-containing protein n=1 Tax=Halorubellus litoreus TaxID=755308 RepID=A0ABD5VEW4_9EURY
MPLDRRTVLEALAAETDAATPETTPLKSLAETLNADLSSVRTHIQALEACSLARIEGDEHVRVTVTGEELLALDTDDAIVVDPSLLDDVD